MRGGLEVAPSTVRDEAGPRSAHVPTDDCGSRTSSKCPHPRVPTLTVVLIGNAGAFELRTRMADQIAQIFRGIAPNIAIERPTVFEFAINQKIANALGLSIPLAVLAQADEVID